MTNVVLFIFSSSSGSASGCSSGSSNGSYSGSSGGGATSSSGLIAPVTGSGNTISGSSVGCLATLHEDCELDSNDAMTSHSTLSLTALPLTRDMLLATQKRRANELRPKPEAYAGLVKI